MAAIEARGLVRRFDDFTAVDGVDLEVRPGEVYGFLGPNGAGKSTLVKMLVTLLAPTVGSASVAGFDVVDRPDEVRLRIGVALQDASLDELQTGSELLRLQGRFYGLSREDVQRRYDDLVRLVDIGDQIDDRVKTYSGGMKRRLDLALALVHDPEVPFLDEPTTGLDPISRQAVWDEVRRLNGEAGLTVFLTTQYLEEADVLADRVGIISGGRLAAEGTPGDLKRSVGEDLVVVTVDGDAESARRTLTDLDGVDGVELRGAEGDETREVVVQTRDGAATLSPVAVALSRAGDDGAQVRVRALEMRTPTLDDVFLDVTGRRLDAESGGDVRHETQEAA